MIIFTTVEWSEKAWIWLKNNSLKDFPGVILISTHDHELMQTVANRIIEIGTNGIIDRECTYDEYLTNEKIKQEREKIYQ